MYSAKTIEELRSLTPSQLTALETLLARQQEQIFSGISVEIMIADFASINELKTKEPERADTRERQLFASCTGSSPNTT